MKRKRNLLDDLDLEFNPRPITDKEEAELSAYIRKSKAQNKSLKRPLQKV